MNAYEDDRLVLVDDAYDADYASDGTSRYGAYLRQRRSWFADHGDDLDAVTFAALAWQVASGPVMAPGYVRRRADVEAVDCWHSDEPGLLVADVEVRLRVPGVLAGPLDGWATWTASRGWDGERPTYDAPEEDRRALLLTAHVRVPIPAGELPEPKVTRLGDVDVAEAKTALAVICRFVNDVAGPAAAYLREVRLGRPA